MSEPLSVDAHLARLRPRWLGWLRVKHRKLVDLHEDILQDASLDLAQFLARNPGAGQSEDEVNRVGFAILRRRAADEYRREVIEWAESGALEKLASEHPSDDPQAVLEISRLLKTVAGLLAKLDRPSRALLLQNEETRTGSTPLSDAERKRLSRLREDLKQQLLAQHGIDLDKALGGREAEAKHERLQTETMVPVLQIVHVTDLHVKEGEANAQRKLHAKKRRALARAAQDLIEKFDFFGWNEGTQGNFLLAAESFTRFLKDWKKKDESDGQDWYGSAQGPGAARTWLIDTGDLTAFGDEESMRKGREHLDEWRAGLGNCESRSLYGNHDAWPEVQPIHALLGLMPGEISAQYQRVRAQPGWDYEAWLSAPLSMDVPGGASRIELYGLDSVCWSASHNTSAVGQLRAEDIQKLRDAISARGASDAPGTRHFRIAAIHHPLVFPYKFFEGRTIFLTRAMRLLHAEDRMRDLRNDRNDPPGLGVLAHLFLSGHTHGCYPAGDIPAGTMGSQSLLTGRQLQLVGGSLMLNLSRKGANRVAAGESSLETRKDRLHNEARIDWTPCQAQILRFYSHPDKPGKLTMIRVPVLAEDGSVYVEGLPTSVSFYFG